jgi:hypothetical protein
MERLNGLAAESSGKPRRTTILKGLEIDRTVTCRLCFFFSRHRVVGVWLARVGFQHARSFEHNRPGGVTSSSHEEEASIRQAMRVSRRVILLVSLEKRVRVPRGDEVHAGPGREGPSPVASLQCLTAVLYGSGGRQSHNGRGGWQEIEDWSRQAPNRDRMPRPTRMTGEPPPPQQR